MLDSSHEIILIPTFLLKNEKADVLYEVIMIAHRISLSPLFI